jgi:GT2 family glycosyltransferase/glycosyltransferase involved in cell wall biosynthesis
VAVVIPVYAGLAVTQDCLAAVFATIPAATRVIVIDDATPEPALATWLDRLHADRRIALLRHVRNQGFPRSANAGLQAAARLPGRPDIVLLNSDTLVTPGWLEGLRAAAHAAADIGTATPFSNDATIVSYPDNTAANPVPETRPLARLARWAARANPGVAIDIPTAVGFCMYLRRECLHDTGLFREDAFAQGYGEENDFCRRAAARGWRHVAVPGVFVAHRGGQSFGAASAALIGRNLAVMERLHPGYAALIAGFQAADPLAPARRRLDMARWRAARAHVRPGAPAGSVLLVTHDNGGGVERVVQARAAALRETGLRAILLRPAIDADGAPQHGICRLDDAAGGFPNLRFAIPAELPELARLLRPDRPARMEIHHLLGHAPEIENLAGKLGIPTDIHVHDYAMFCPRISLVGRDKRYCGEPEDPAVCEACIADLGRNTAEALPIVELRARSARQLAAARQVVVPSRDVARRWRRHFPAIAPSVAPLEDDTAWPPVARPPTRGAARHVCLIGAIGTEKGYDVLLACARDAATRGLALHFTVVGHTPDDDALMQTGRVFVTGPYREAEAEALIRAQSAHLAWLPSICPETWCFALGHAWRAGLGVAAFDIGAPAERIRSTGRGWVFPLGLPPPSINTALLAADLVVER